MFLLVVMLFLATGLYAIVRLFRMMATSRVSGSWWCAYLLLTCAGLAVGYWCAFLCEYAANARYRIAGVPIPICFFHLEDGHWVDFPVPQAQAWVTAITNVVLITVVATAPLRIARLRRRLPKGSVTTA